MLIEAETIPKISPPLKDLVCMNMASDAYLPLVSAIRAATPSRVPDIVRPSLQEKMRSLLKGLI